MCSKFRQKVKTCYMFSKTCYMFPPLPPIGGHKNFFGTRDLRQSISRARKPLGTKNQPFWRKNFFFLDTEWACTPPLKSYRILRKMWLTKKIALKLTEICF